MTARSASSAPHAVVIGAGFGGLGAAVRLRARGYRVTVVEANEQAGGRASVFKREGYTFDAGPTVITAPYLIEELFEGDMRADWGWRAPRAEPRGTALQAPIATSRIELDVGGLDVPYFCGWITVDFGAREVRCLAVDQKTPADERWTLKPDAVWWVRAMSCVWPLPQAS